VKTVRYILWGLALLALVVAAGHQLSHFLGTDAENVDGFQPAFTLVSHQGDTVSEATYRGNWVLVFFGFTNCPDICPTTLAELADVMDGLGNAAAKVTPLFITIDPVRDRVENVAEYVSAFHPSIVGLTGTDKQVAEAAKSFKAYFERVPQDSAPDGYTMGHTSVVYLISPKGHFVRTFKFRTPPEMIIEDLKERI
jgi:protein SCO1/2